MILRYNRDSELEVVGMGIFSPGFECRINNEVLGKKYINSGYFDEIKEVKKEVKIKIKKSKKKGVDK